MRTVEGISVEELGHAVQQVCFSEGISIKQLANDAGVHPRIVSGWFQGNAISDAKIYATLKALDESTRLSLKKPADVMSQAKEFPEISKASVTKAIQSIAGQRALSLKEVERRKKRLLPTRFTDGHPSRPADLEAEYYAAKALGFASLGALMQAAQALPAEIPDPVLMRAVETLRHEKNIPKLTFAKRLGLTEDGYHFSLRAGAFSAKTKLALPAALGLSPRLPLQGILDEVEKLEPLPDRQQFGAAVKKLRLTQGFTVMRFAETLECNSQTLARIESGENGQGAPSSGWLRQIPPLLGCDSMRQIMEKANEVPSIAALARPKTGRRNAGGQGAIGHVTAVLQQLAAPSKDEPGIG